MLTRIERRCWFFCLAVWLDKLGRLEYGYLFLWAVDKQCVACTLKNVLFVLSRSLSHILFSLCAFALLFFVLVTVCSCPSVWVLSHTPVFLPPSRAPLSGTVVLVQSPAHSAAAPLFGSCADTPVFLWHSGGGVCSHLYILQLSLCLAWHSRFPPS